MFEKTLEGSAAFGVGDQVIGFLSPVHHNLVALVGRLLDLLAVIIEVVDNGTGIPEDMQSKVFSPFCTTKARGVGLGLPIVRRTMIDHSALISIESSDVGTVVCLTLPAAAVKRGGEA